MFKKIVVPLDESECAQRAFQIALEMAKLAVAELGICSVVDPLVVVGTAPPSPAMDIVVKDMEIAARHRVENALEQARKAEVAAHGEMLVGVAFDRILDFAKRDSADLIVMGTHGRTGLPHFFLGSVAEMVLRKATCPVLIARDGSSGGDKK